MLNFLNFELTQGQ